MPSETTGGFGRTFGSIAAIITIAALGVGLYFGWGWVQKSNTNVQNAKQHSADSTRVHLDSLKQEQLVALVAANANSARRAADATARVAIATQSANSAKAELAIAQHVADSLRDAARTAADSAAASTASTVPLTRATELVARQWFVDSSAIAGKDSVIQSVRVERDTARAEVKTEEAIAKTWQDKFLAEKRKTPPKWQSVTVKVAEALGIALVTHLVFK